MDNSLAALTDAQDQQTKISLIRTLRAIRRDWWLLAGTVFVVAAVAFFVTRFQTPLYQSSALILFNEDDGGLGLRLDADPRQADNRGLETDMAVIRSRQVASRVVEILGLNLRIGDAAIQRSDVVSSTRQIGPIEPGEYALRRTGNDYQLMGSGGRIISESVHSGSEIEFGGLEVTFAPSLGEIEAERISLVVSSTFAAADGLRATMEVLRPGGPARVLSLTYRSTDPYLAAAVPNAFAEAFIELNSTRARAELDRRVSFLSDQVASYETDLALAEDRLRDYREDVRVVNLETEGEEQVRRQVQLQVRRDSVQTELSSLGRLLEDAEQGSTGGISPYRQLASFPYLFANAIVRDLLTTLTEAENRRSDLLLRRTPQNADVQAIDTRIRELEAQLFQFADNYRVSLRNQLSSLDEGLAELGEGMADIPARELQFARLEREREQIAEMYALLEQRLKETEIEAAALPAEAQILDPALVPGAPVSPRPLVNLAVGILVGLLLGLIAILVRSRVDTTLWGPEDATEAAMELPLLAQVPRIPANGAGGMLGLATVARRSLPSRTLGNGSAQQDSVVLIRQSDSAAAEAFRGLRDSLVTSSQGSAPRTVVITSVLPGEGKSTTAANVALAFAEQDLRTLLVDVDFRGGRVHQLFDLPDGPGLREMLEDGLPVELALHHLEGGAVPSQFYVLRSGSNASIGTPYRGMRQIPTVMESLGEQFDVIIMDAPPIGIFTDARVLAGDSEAVVLVARVGSTPKEALERAVQQISALPTPVRGLVLNEVPLPPGADEVYTDYSRRHSQSA